MFETIYSAALERQYIQSQQRPAPPLIVLRKPSLNLGPTKPRSQSFRQIVLRYLRAQPGVFTSCDDIAEALGEDRRRTAYTLGDLAQEGIVQKQYVAHRGHKSNPQRYRAR